MIPLRNMSVLKPRVILADDHTLILEGLKGIVASTSCELLETVHDGRSLVASTTRLKPELVITDISMPILNGIEAVRQIRKQNAATKVIVLSMHSDASYVREAFQAGTDGYILKSSAVSELQTAMTRVLSGELYVSPQITTEPVKAFLVQNAGSSFGRQLTPRQREVLQLLAEGKQGKEIAAVLGISAKTVEFHKMSIMDALGIRTTAELTRYALEHGIVGA